MATLKKIRNELRSQGNPQKADFHSRFFRTGKGEYGEGDRFLGLTVPQVRAIEKKYRKTVCIEDAVQLLKSEWHEERLLALVILVEKFKRADQAERKKIHRLYLKMRATINNWDLIDTSAPTVVGLHLIQTQQDPLRALSPLVRSKRLWDRRIAMLATQAYIRAGDTRPAFQIATLLLQDSHDLIHKASGWMLREAGKKDERSLREFLDRHAAKMPRTMLRYAIERLPSADRHAYLSAGAPHERISLRSNRVPPKLGQRTNSKRRSKP